MAFPWAPVPSSRCTMPKLKRAPRNLPDLNLEEQMQLGSGKIQSNRKLWKTEMNRNHIWNHMKWWNHIWNPLSWQSFRRVNSLPASHSCSKSNHVPKETWASRWLLVTQMPRRALHIRSVVRMFPRKSEKHGPDMPWPSGWWFQPLWKIWKSVGMILPNIWVCLKIGYISNEIAI